MAHSTERNTIRNCALARLPRLLSMLLVAVVSLHAFTPPARPAGAVYDDAGLLTPEGKARLETLVANLWDKAHFALGVALVQDIGDEEARSAALSTAQSWGLGQKGQDEAALIFVAVQQRRRSIEVGYGSESYLPDALTERIQQKTMVPAFREGKFELGILAASQAIAYTVAEAKGIAPDSLGLDRRRAPRTDMPADARSHDGAVFLLFLFIILIIAIRFKGRGGGGGNFRGPRGPILGPPMGGFGGGFGSSRGGFGGGFGGFGGGSFGGGGSGGGW